MAMKTWTAVPAPDVTGWIVRWHARKNNRTLGFEQLPLLRVTGGSPIVIGLLPSELYGEVTSLCAVIELDEHSPQALAGRHYLVAFNPER